MRGLAEAIADALPAKSGFCLLVFEMNTDQGTMSYISNANREDMVKALKEFISKAEKDARGPPN